MWIFAVGRAINMTQVVTIEFQRPLETISAAILHLSNGLTLTIQDEREITEIVRYYQQNAFPSAVAPPLVTPLITA